MPVRVAAVHCPRRRLLVALLVGRLVGHLAAAPVVVVALSSLPSSAMTWHFFPTMTWHFFSDHESALFAVVLAPLVIHGEGGVGGGGRGFYLAMNVRFEHFFFTF